MTIFSFGAVVVWIKYLYTVGETQLSPASFYMQISMKSLQSSILTVNRTSPNFAQNVVVDNPVAAISIHFPKYTKKTILKVHFFQFVLVTKKLYKVFVTFSTPLFSFYQQLWKTLHKFIKFLNALKNSSCNTVIYFSIDIKRLHTVIPNDDGFKVPKHFLYAWQTQKCLKIIGACVYT